MGVCFADASEWWLCNFGEMLVCFDIDAGQHFN